MLTLTKEQAEKLTDAIMTTLHKRFEDEFIFGPIVMETKVDYYGDEYLKIRIIYEGDRAKLDPAWTLGLMGRIRPTLDELEISGTPSKSFVSKTEWEEGPPE